MNFELVFVIVAETERKSLRVGLELRFASSLLCGGPS